MKKSNGIAAKTAKLFVTAALAIGAANIVLADDGHAGKDKVLYIWAQDQAHVAPDFLAVINFDEESSNYGKVIKAVPLPPPGNIGNEPHHCHLNSSKTILGCGGLLSLLTAAGFTIREVDVFSGPRLRKYLKRRARESGVRPLTDEEIERIYKAANVAFPHLSSGSPAS